MPEPLAAPVAVFLGWQDQLTGEPPLALYNVTGGPLDGSTVTAERLRAEGIMVPGDAVPYESQDYDVRQGLMDALGNVPGWRAKARACLGLPPPKNPGRTKRDHVCEGCGLVVNGSGLPLTWVGCGWSHGQRRGAEWCPKCQDDGTFNVKCIERKPRP